jgi:heme exporter protein CcmD
VIDSIIHFFNMNGHGGYVFSAYGAVFVFLLVQWFIPWQRWRHYLREQKKIGLKK